MSLQQIQEQLNAPKNQMNRFGGYKYRSAEDILTALKPLLAKYQYSLVINDTLELIGDRYYVKATASLYDDKMSLITHSSAYAREELSLKGQQASQITGGTSSYARKYALNGLFLIDDSKDADTMDNRSHEATVKQPPKVNAKQVKLIQTLISKKNIDEDTVSMLKSHYNIESWNDLPAASMNKLIEWFEKKPDIIIE